MSTPLLTDEEMKQLAEKGWVIYGETLKSRLKREYNKKASEIGA